MPKKSPTPREIIRHVTGFSVDPLVEKIGRQLISRYRKNRARFGRADAVQVTLNGYLDDLFGRGRLPRNLPRAAVAKPTKRAKSQEEIDDEIMARLKAELDRRIAARERS